MSSVLASGNLVSWLCCRWDSVFIVIQFLNLHFAPEKQHTYSIKTDK